MKAALETLIAGNDLTESEAGEVMRSLADAATYPAVAGALLAALRTKGETPAEIRGFAQAMRSLAIAPSIPGSSQAVDIVGTGGDGSGSLNLSTGAALLTAACGRLVLKHGNRSVSSLCGSADVLEKLGYDLPPDAEAARRDAERFGFTFLFAPHFHPAMKAVASVRRTLGVRTVFNLLGPLTNPAAPGYAVVGAPSPEIAQMLAEALTEMPVRRAFVVHGAEGWDEATPVGPFLRFDVREGRVDLETINPEDHGVSLCQAVDLVGGTADVNANRLADALAGEPGPALDALALGAGLALEVTGHTETLAEGVSLARRTAEQGRATSLLRALRASSCDTVAVERKAKHA